MGSMVSAGYQTWTTHPVLSGTLAEVLVVEGWLQSHKILSQDDCGDFIPDLQNDILMPSDEHIIIFH